ATQALQTLHAEGLNLYQDSFAFEAYQFCMLLRSSEESGRNAIAMVMTTAAVNVPTTGPNALLSQRGKNPLAIIYSNVKDEEIAGDDLGDMEMLTSATVQTTGPALTAKCIAYRVRGVLAARRRERQWI
ncbi:1066_t:CDS:2, partial [Acaulospora colombiana]